MEMLLQFLLASGLIYRVISVLDDPVPDQLHRQGPKVLENGLPVFTGYAANLQLL